jgi:DNA polymerase I-like protein with 3'-5' exonuclease and polymerase domains
VVKIIRPRKQTLDPNQIPLITPESNWEVPKELPDLTRVGEIALDTENRDNGISGGRGPGWAFGDGYVAGVGVAWRTGTEIQRIYVPVRHPETDNFPKEQVARWVTDITRKNRVVFFNAGYDIGWLNADMGVPVPPVIDDASCAAFLIDENREDLSLDGVCAWRGVPGKDLDALRDAATVYGYKAQDAVANIARLPARYAAPYGSQDPVSTLMVMEDLRPELAKQGLLQAYSVEMRLVPLIHAMRRKGIRINIDRAVQFQARMRDRSTQALGALTERLGRHVGIEEVRSHKWLLATHEMEGVTVPTFRGDTAAFEKDWMRRAEHWLPRLIAEAKQCADMAEKFVGTYMLDFAHRGRLHANVNQWKYEEGGTRSHRLSYSDPPLQQAPSRPEPFEGWALTGENAVEYRSCFEPEEGELWFSPDYSQQEYRHIVADAEKLGLEKAEVAGDMYRNDPKTDFHNLVVSLTGLPRRHAKDCNFAKAFGAGVPKFATMISKPLAEAQEIMGQYDKELPFVRQLGSRCESLAQSRGWIKLFDGARCHFDLWEAAWLSKEERNRGYAWNFRMSPCSLEEARERQKQTIGDHAHPWQGSRLKRAYTHKAMNRRIQGNAARQMKLAMATCWEQGHVPMLQMHDELSFSLTDKKAGDRIEEIMRTVYTCSVPFLVDAEWGLTWGDAKHTHAAALAKLRAATAPVAKNRPVRAARASVGASRSRAGANAPRRGAAE